MLYEVVLTFKSVDETLVCDHSSESYLAVLSCSTVYYMLSKVRRNKETFQFCRAYQITAHIWLIVCNGPANQITPFAFVLKTNSTKTR